MFLDDIADAVKDTAKTVGEGVGKIGSVAFNTVLSPTESFAMGGLGAAASTVANVFGGVELFESGIKSVDGIGHSNLPLAGILGTALGVGANIAEHGSIGNNPLDLVKTFSGAASKGEAFGNEVFPFPDASSRDQQAAQLEADKAKANAMKEKEAIKQAREEENAESSKNEDLHPASDARLKGKTPPSSKVNRAMARWI